MILLKNISTLFLSSTQIETGWDLLIKEERISLIGENLFPGDVPEGITVIDCSGKSVIPGFVNSHTHIYQNYLKGISDQLGLKAWCEEVTFPFAGVVHKERETGNDELCYYWTLLGSMEMIRSGITAFVDMGFTFDSFFEACEKIGIRGTAAFQHVDRWIPKENLGSLDEKKADIINTIETWHGKGLQRVAMAPSTPFTCTREFMDWIKETARKYGLSLYTHVSETEWEVEQSFEENDMSPFAYLDKIGFLDRPLAAVHAVCVDENDIRIMKERNISVLYNPKSNAKLGSGVAPITRYLKEGIPVAVATDGAASNDLLDMFEEMRFGALIQKASAKNPEAVSAGQLFRMATETAAEIVGLESGLLKEGYLADLVILNENAAHKSPVNDPMQNLVYCGKSSDVESVIINGKFVFKDNRFLNVDESEILDKAQSLFREKYSPELSMKMEAQF